MITETKIINWVVEAIINAEGLEKWNSMSEKEQHDEIMGVIKYWNSVM